MGGIFTTHNGVTSNCIARLNADGTRDTAFTTAIGTGFNSAVNSVKIQADGKILVGGNFSTHNSVTSSRIARLNADGTRDTAFTTNIGTGFSGGAVNDIKILPNSKIVVVGVFTTHSGVTSNYISCLNTNGTRDINFTTAIGIGFNSTVAKLEVEENGKIVAIGDFVAFNSNVRNRIARLGGDLPA